MNKTAIIILAAGKSTRFPQHKLHTLLAGKSILEHTISNASAIPNSDVYIVMQTDSMHAKLPTLHQTSPTGTGGALEEAIQQLPCVYKEVMVIFADSPLIQTTTIQKLQGKTCALIMQNSIRQYGKLIIDNGIITGIAEYKDPAYNHITTNFTCSGAINFALPSDQLLKLLQKLPILSHGEKFLTDIFAHIETSVLEITPSEGLGINTVEDFILAEELLQEQLISKAIDAGAIIHDPNSVKMQYDSILEKGCIIHPYVVFGEKVHIKSNANILPFSVINASTVAGTVGPFAHVRSGTIVHEKAVIGSFVETKNTTLHSNSKAKHLTYLGDTNIGPDTNIGAGVITCNYNKTKGIKSKTEIGANCDIGANSSLVAPLTIHNKAQIGAGSVITKDIPSETLAVSRSEQRNFTRSTTNKNKN